jgi:hypothetical protein
MAMLSLVAACAISVAYIFAFGVDWAFTFRSSTVASAAFTCLILSAWASVPYFILLPMARRESRSLLTILAATVILSFGIFSMNQGRHTPGDEGGSYIVVPLQQMLIAGVILLGWRLIRGAAR